MLQKFLSIAFYLAGASFLVFVAYLIAPSGGDVDTKRISFALAASFTCFAFANIERVSSLGILGMKITLIEAKKVVADATIALDQLRGIAVVLSEVLVEKLQSEGRFGGGKPEQREEHKQKLLAALRELKVPAAEIKRVEGADQKWVKIDYVEELFHKIPIEVAQNKAWGERWAPYHNIHDRPNPGECQLIMKEFNIDDQERKEILKDYRYYMRTGRHRRPDHWFGRYRKRYETASREQA